MFVINVHVHVKINILCLIWLLRATGTWTTHMLNLQQCLQVTMHLRQGICVLCVHTHTHIYACTLTPTHNNLTLATTCATQDSTYALAAIWGVMHIAHTACHDQHAPHVHASHPHPTTHSSWSDVRPSNTPKGSVVIWLPESSLLRHAHTHTYTHTHRGWVVKQLPHTLVHFDAFSQWHECNNGLFQQTYTTHVLTVYVLDTRALANMIMLAFKSRKSMSICTDNKVS